MLAVNPYIAFKGNCRQAIEFYKTALGADVVFTQTAGESPMSDMGPATNIMPRRSSLPMCSTQALEPELKEIAVAG